MKKISLLNFILLFITLSSQLSIAQAVTTLAGSTAGYLDGAPSSAQFNLPFGITVDASGNSYVADFINNRIRKITAAGVVSTFAGGTQGSADGTGTAAQFFRPIDITIDNITGNLYVSDQQNCRIRKITPGGVVTTLAGSTCGFTDGTGTAAKFAYPFGIAIDALQNIYVADSDNHKIRKITPGGVVTTVAGSTAGFANGNVSIAQFSDPFGLCVDSSGVIYIADSNNHKIRKITNGEVTTVAGNAQGYADGTGIAAQFNRPYKLVLDASQNLYIADTYNHKIRKITTAGVVTTLAGSAQGYTDGTGTAAQFNTPIGIVLDSSDNLFICDGGNNKIRKVATTLSIEQNILPFTTIVYPNPSNGIYTITADANTTVEIFDIVGKLILSQKNTMGQATINLSQYTAGMYLAKITNQNNQTKTVKLIKQ